MSHRTYQSLFLLFLVVVLLRSLHGPEFMFQKVSPSSYQYDINSTKTSKTLQFFIRGSVRIKNYDFHIDLNNLYTYV